MSTGVVDVRTIDGDLVVGGIAGTSVTLVAGGANSSLTLGGPVNAGTGNVTMSAGERFAVSLGYR